MLNTSQHLFPKNCQKDPSQGQDDGEEKRGKNGMFAQGKKISERERKEEKTE